MKLQSHTRLYISASIAYNFSGFFRNFSRPPQYLTARPAGYGMFVSSFIILHLSTMALLKMVRGKDNVILRTLSTEIKKIDRKLVQFIEDMKETMDHEKGVGLAAPQVGVNQRVVVCKFNHGTPHELIIGMINPVITNRSKQFLLDDEGCLSLPKQFDSVARYQSLTVKFTDVKGREQILKLSGFNARIVQHEVDHIEGKLYIDHVNDPETLELRRKAAAKE